MDFNKKTNTVIDENTENFFVKKSATELAHEAAIAALDPNYKIKYPCEDTPVDESCTKRWIQSLGDCA
jgi:hypothetical protein